MSICVHSAIRITYIIFSITGSHYSPVNYNDQNSISAQCTKQTQHVNSEISVFILNIPTDSALKWKMDLSLRCKLLSRRHNKTLFPSLFLSVPTQGRRSHINYRDPAVQGPSMLHLVFVFLGSIYHYLLTDKLIKPPCNRHPFWFGIRFSAGPPLLQGPNPLSAALLPVDCFLWLWRPNPVKLDTLRNKQQIQPNPSKSTATLQQTAYFLPARDKSNTKAKLARPVSPIVCTSHAQQHRNWTSKRIIRWSPQNEKLDLNLCLVVTATQIHSCLARCFIIIMNSLGQWKSWIT